MTKRKKARVTQRKDAEAPLDDVPPDLTKLTYRDLAILLTNGGAHGDVDRLEQELRRWCESWTELETVNWVEVVARLAGTCAD